MSANLQEQVRKALSEQQFDMPKPFVGGTVAWYPSGKHNVSPVPMMVQKVGDRAISGLVFFPGKAPGPAVSGVNHIDDPLLQLRQRVEEGAWDFLPHEAEFRELQKQVAKLTEELKRSRSTK